MVRSLLLAALAAACAREGGEAGPRLQVRWTGADTAVFSGVASAEWCDSMRVLEITAASGDTGVGLAVFPRAGLESGRYPIRVRLPKDSLARPDSGSPSAAIAMRWFARSVVRGFQGDSGELVLEKSAAGRLGGRFTAGARSIHDDSRLQVSGSFTDVVPRPERAGCRAPAAATSGDSVPPSDTGAGVH